MDAWGIAMMIFFWLIALFWFLGMISTIFFSETVGLMCGVAMIILVFLFTSIITICSVIYMT